MEKFSLDRIEDNFAVLQNLETGKMQNVELSLLPKVKEKDIIIFEDNLYRVEDKEREERLKIIKEKLAKIKGE